MTNAELIYIAGFYEGEGTCFFYVHKRKGKGKGELKLGIAQKYLPILKWIKTVFGNGYICFNRHSKTYAYLTASKNARLILNKLLPFMRCPHKIRQAKKSLALDRKYINRPRRLK